MGALQRKLLRDLRRLWPQALAIALVLAAGAATLILGIGGHASLSETRRTYYERNGFADVFVNLTRAPNTFAEELQHIPGVAAVETRIAKIALLDIGGMSEPASAMFVSLPDLRPQRLNQLHIRSGRTPMPADEREAIISEPFAKAHGLRIGSTFDALLNGRKRSLHVVGTALSPEFVYALGPGDLMPDDRRFGVVWMSEKTLAGAFDLVGAFSSVNVKLLPGASEAAVIEAMDAALARYGGLGAHGRRDQTSHAFLDAELKQLQATSRISPPIFLLVAAFLVNMTLSRLITLEREQIGLLKALGYSDTAVALHYLQFAVVIACVGIAIGAFAGTWLGFGLTRLYADFFHFPFLVFRTDPLLYAGAAGVTLASALAGAFKAVRQVVRLPPAVAMAPPPPAQYRKHLGNRLFVLLRLPQSLLMVIRHLLRWPGRSLSSVAGMAMAVGILVGSLWAFGSVEEMIDVTFHRADRQDATISFVRERRMAALAEVTRLPGVLAAEPYRSVPARIRHGAVERRIAIMGKPANADLSRVLDQRFEAVRLPESGIALSGMLARLLDARVGDVVEIELLERDRRRVAVAVAAVIQGYLGLNAYMDLRAANALLREGELVSGTHILFDPAQREALFTVLKQTPAASFVALQTRALERFRETLAQNLLFMITIYVALGGIIAFGVVYNFARISLSEQGRELASLRVLGFSQGEVSTIVLSELAIVTILAQPIGWLIGYVIAFVMVRAFENELYRVPLVVATDVYAWATVIVIASAALSAIAVRRRIARLDLVEVLKTRE